MKKITTTFILIFFYCFSYSQSTLITYHENRVVTMPKTDDTDLIRSVKAIIKEADNTIYEHKLTLTDNNSHITIDTIFFKEGYIKNPEISYDRIRIDFFKTDGITYKQIYIRPYEAIKVSNLKHEEFHDQTRQINGYKCYKVNSSYLGKDYTLWVTKDLDITGGPLIFNNFPFLVVEAISKKRIFKLHSIESTNEECLKIDPKLKTISYEQHRKDTGL